ncbi:MAG TPA: hypothetical protein VMD47_10415 [Candidatus Acidoferrales bacterium]|nr:hypothetical protein [Candidatus Acidoferrales bacterium]
MKNLSDFARSGRAHGTTDVAAFRESLERMNAQLLRNEVYGVLKDFQAEALYGAAVALTAACTVGDSSEWRDTASIKAAFERACEKLRKFWTSMGEAV